MSHDTLPDNANGFLLNETGIGPISKVFMQVK